MKSHFEPRRLWGAEFLIIFLCVSVAQWLNFQTFARGLLMPDTKFSNTFKVSTLQVEMDQLAGRLMRYGSLNVRTKKTAICARVTSDSGQ